jgi:two-component system, OmpR family, phosphate regulon response regulator PhoB
MPFGKNQTADKRQPQGEARADFRPRILLAEDDLTLLQMERIQLEQEGFEVITSQNGAEALALARELKPAAVLIDVMLPQLNGRQVCKMLKTDPATAAIAIFFITGLGEEEDIERYRGCLADGYFIKPFQMEKIVQRLKTVLAKRQGAPPSPERN